MFVELIRLFIYVYRKIGEKSPETIALRKKISDGCEQLIWEFFEGGGQVVIYDANNGRKAARNAIAERFDKAGIHVVMLGVLFHIDHASPFDYCMSRVPKNLCATTKKSSKLTFEA